MPTDKPRIVAAYAPKYTRRKAKAAPAAMLHGPVVVEARDRDGSGRRRRRASLATAGHRPRRKMTTTAPGRQPTGSGRRSSRRWRGECRSAGPTLRGRGKLRGQPVGVQHDRAPQRFVTVPVPYDQLGRQVTGTLRLPARDASDDAGGLIEERFGVIIGNVRRVPGIGQAAVSVAMGSSWGFIYGQGWT